MGDFRILCAANCTHCATGDWDRATSMVRRQFGAMVAAGPGPVAMTVENAKRLRALKTERADPRWRMRSDRSCAYATKG